ncbi:MAG: hypothetical protein IKQ15_04155 [Kiritimatiellae bacterium]|nr:hypothetical protein [Kiritimatiellia bacterium]
MAELPQLYVEGKDDLFSLVNLLERHGISFELGQRKVEFKTTDSVTAMLDNLCSFVKSARNKKQPVGFVLDADVDGGTRWTSIKDKLKAEGFEVPDDALAASGTILEFPDIRVGFWLMPDNTSLKGKLEDFLKTLIHPDDPLLAPALAYVKDVKDKVPETSRFPDKDVEKAEISAWLAVQKEPGLPYGTAIGAKFFIAHSEVADRFVEWFRGLYSLLGEPDE